MTTRKTDAELKPCPFGCHHRESKLVEALKKAKGALESCEVYCGDQDFDKEKVEAALAHIIALLSTEAQQ